MIARLWLALLWRFETLRMRNAITAPRRLSQLRDVAAQATATEADVQAYSRALRAYWRNKNGGHL